MQDLIIPPCDQSTTAFLWGRACSLQVEARTKINYMDTIAQMVYFVKHQPQYIVVDALKRRTYMLCVVLCVLNA